jgi:hypothetical protein
MLFNSFAFILVFLPGALIIFYGLGRYDRRAAAGFLGVASICFYGWWDSRYHANDRGRTRYTQRVLASLCQVMTCP